MNQSLHKGVQQRRDWPFIKPQTELQEGQGGQILRGVEQEAVLFKHMVRTVFSGLTQSTSRQKAVPCTKQFLTTAFNPTNNMFFKTETKILLLNKRHKPKWTTHNDLQSTQEYFRGKLCSVSYQQFCPFIFSIGSNLECSRWFFCCQLFLSLVGDFWFIAPFSALWKWYRFNFFLCKLPLTLTLQRIWWFLESWKP